MEGNGYYGENDQGYGDGWGNNNRRNATSGQAGLYTNETYMQRGLYDTSGSYGSDMGAAQRMAYPYGQMDMTNSVTQRDMSYGRSLDYDASAGHNAYQAGAQNSSQKRMLSTYESDMALLQGGSYAGSSPFGKETQKRRPFEEEAYPGSQQGGNFNSFGQKGGITYKAVAPPEVGAFAYDKYVPSKQRPFGFRDYDTAPRKSLMFDDSRYRLGSGNPAPGNVNSGFPGGRGRGRGRGRGGFQQGNYQQGVSGGNWQNRGQKRNEGFQGPYPKKKKTPSNAVKNPISFLNEIRPDTDFNVSDMNGPSNMPTFTVSLEFDGETYTASARSKKLAKRYVAEAALKAYLQTPAARQLGYSESQIDFSNGPEEGVTTGNNTSNDESKPKAASTAKGLDENVGGKNPVMFLNELRKDAVYDLKEETGQAHNKNFIMRVTVCGQEFEGSGQSKKLAKSAAAREALKGLGLAGKELPTSTQSEESKKSPGKEDEGSDKGEEASTVP